MPLFYLSFCDLNRPSGEQFLGATIVEAASIFGVRDAATRAGCNPGGEIAIIELDEDAQSHSEFPDYFNKFVARDDVLKDGQATDMADTEIQPVLICQEHNPRRN